MRPDISSTQLGGIANLALMAPVRPGFVPGADTFTYARRLELFFKTLNAIRLGSRESARCTSPFPDALGRWGILHSFRYALIPPQIGSGGEAEPPQGALRAGVYRLYLNVTFDGGWEPYMRVIYRDLGPLLDTIFSNCDDYPASSRHSYDDYIRWVRRQEVPEGIFYTDSSMSVLDQHYLEAVERIQRHEPDAGRARALIAALSLKPPPEALEALGRFAAADEQTREEVVANNLRALKGLYDLRAVYPDNEQGDEDCLLRFALGAMPEFRTFLRLHGAAFDRFREPIAWLLRSPKLERPETAPAAHYDAADIQDGIVSRLVGVTHGCMLLAAVSDAAKARRWIKGLAQDMARHKHLAGGGLYWNIAFSARGLRALGLTPQALDLFPQEFVEGMEARAGMLGDVRGNHPEHWRRPRFKGAEIDLGSVHVVLQVRLAAHAEADQPLHSLLRQLAQALDDGDNGLRLLSTEALRSYPAADHITTEHFGFQDGFSQPVPGNGAVPTGAAFDDHVALGELLMGHPNDRQDGRFPPQPNALMDNGSFLVVRKLRQHVARWRAVLREAALADDPHFDARQPAEQDSARQHVASMMMGRQPDGTLVLDPAQGTSNNFNYDGDPLGSRCPFQSHIRRTNPRTLSAGRRRVPRLMRRGMSYGPRWQDEPDAERGLYFMAYCGSIAEQFEVIQRWIAGGNSSGILASHSDPMLGVPQKGSPRSFQWLGKDGKVVRVDLGDQPMTELQWGLYLFAPSLSALQALSDPPAAPQAAARAAPQCPLGHEAYDPTGPVFEQRKRMLQGQREDRDQLWQRINECGGSLQTAYGLLLSTKSDVLAALGPDSPYSVCGYGRRFEESVGPGYLGMDPHLGHKRLAEDSGINAAIAAIDERQAFTAARQITQTLLEKIAPAGRPWPVDIVRLSEQAIAQLYRRWFGLPDGRFMREGFSTERIDDLDDDIAACPRDFFFVARHIFGAHPAAAERKKGPPRGKAIQVAIRGYIKSTPPEQLVCLSRKIHDKLVKQTRKGPDYDEVVHIIGGVMLGFGPSVHIHYVNVMREWVEMGLPHGPSIWDLQTQLLAKGLVPAAVDDEVAADAAYDSVCKELRNPLIRQMCKEPVPSVIWRERPGSMLGNDGREPEKTVLGLHGLMHDADAEVLMFGGARDHASPLHTSHACPGSGMATGVLLGIISTLLLAGTLRKSPSPTILMLAR